MGFLLCYRYCRIADADARHVGDGQEAPAVSACLVNISDLERFARGRFLHGEAALGNRGANYTVVLQDHGDMGRAVQDPIIVQRGGTRPFDPDAERGQEQMVNMAAIRKIQAERAGIGLRAFGAERNLPRLLRQRHAAGVDDLRLQIR